LHTLSFIGLFSFGLLALWQYLRSTSFLVKVVEEKFGKDNEELESLVGAVSWVVWTAFLLGILYSLSFDLGILTETKEGYLRLGSARLFILHCEGFFLAVALLQYGIFKPWWTRLSKRYESGSAIFAKR
jgi:hypothetical protein